MKDEILIYLPLIAIENNTQKVNRFSWQLNQSQRIVCTCVCVKWELRFQFNFPSCCWIELFFSSLDTRFLCSLDFIAVIYYTVVSLAETLYHALNIKFESEFIHIMTHYSRRWRRRQQKQQHRKTIASPQIRQPAN